MCGRKVEWIDYAMRFLIIGIAVKVFDIVGLDNIPYVQTWMQVLKKRSFLALIWGAGAAIVAGIVVLIFGLMR